MKVEIDVLDKGFAVTADGRRFGFTSMDDLLIGLSDIIEPEPPQPVSITVDKADPDSDMSVTHIDRPDGTSSTTWTKRDGSSETIEDDGWREWDGQLHGRKYPPGVDADSSVVVLMRGNSSVVGGPTSANNLRWYWSDGINSDPRGDIIRYRVVRP